MDINNTTELLDYLTKKYLLVFSGGKIDIMTRETKTIIIATLDTNTINK